MFSLLSLSFITAWSGLRTSDIYQNNKTNITYNPVKTGINSNGEEYLIISNIKTKEKTTITLSDFRANYSLLKSGDFLEQPFYI